MAPASQTCGIKRVKAVRCLAPPAAGIQRVPGPPLPASRPCKTCDFRNQLVQLFNLFFFLECNFFSDKILHGGTFLAASFVIPICWEQPECPSADEWISRLWCTHQQNATQHQKGTATRVPAQTNVKIIVLRESQVKQGTYL